VYVVAPVVVKFREDPGQKGALDKRTGVGVAVTETFAEAEVVQPSEFVTTKLYVPELFTVAFEIVKV
jgi:hypothetical protein